jgi:hypothetical protein
MAWWTDDMIAARLFEREGEILLAACDGELLGRTLRSDGMKLTVSRIFYSDVTVTENELREMMLKATTMNLVGNTTVAIARELGLVSGNVLCIEGVEHAQTVRMRHVMR